VKIRLSAFRQPVLSLGLGAGAAATEDAFVLLWIHVDGCISRCIQWQEHPPTGLHYEERKGASEEVNWSQKSVEHDKACSIIAPATGKKKGHGPSFNFAISFSLPNFFFTCSFYSLGYVEFIIFTVNEGKIQVLSSMG